MKATEFEFRHQALVHQLIVGAAFLTYLIQPDDIVWQFVKDRAEPHALERGLFIVATLLIAGGAALCTWARAETTVGPWRYAYHPRYLGEFLYAIGLGSLAPHLDLLSWWLAKEFACCVCSVARAMAQELRGCIARAY